MQYNPDQATSFCCQWGAQWFQTAIISNPNGCGSFTIQVYSLTSNSLVWRADQIFGPCSKGYLAQGATWTIQEDMKSSSDRTIVDVYFSVQSPTTSYSYTLYPGSSHWV